MLSPYPSRSSKASSSTGRYALIPSERISIRHSTSPCSLSAFSSSSISSLIFIIQKVLTMRCCQARPQLGEQADGSIFGSLIIGRCPKKSFGCSTCRLLCALLMRYAATCGCMTCTPPCSAARSDSTPSRLASLRASRRIRKVAVRVLWLFASWFYLEASRIFWIILAASVREILAEDQTNDPTFTVAIGSKYCWCFG